MRFPSLFKKLNYVYYLIYFSYNRRKFQKFQDKKIKINTGDRTHLEQAKTHGNLHEVLLDRRAKMKADRYCK